MKKTICLLLALAPSALVQPVLGETYKTTYSAPCSLMWSAVKDALSNQQNYDVKKVDNAQMSSDYQLKHEVHFDLSGVLLQRENHVRLVAKGSGCEIQVVSNYGGRDHNDEGDFKKRVAESLKKIKGGGTPAEPVVAAATPTDARPALTTGAKATAATQEPGDNTPLGKPE